MTQKTKKTKKVKKATSRRSRTVRNAPKGAPSSVFYLLDAKGKLFDVHKTRTDAFYDAVGPRFYKGYYIVEYKRGSARRYKYQATQREVVRVP
jgi:predicted GNAT superfamily acetyltransferase